jgi:DNA-directed RNA polymerase subunit E'/Rpb7
MDEDSIYSKTVLTHHVSLSSDEIEDGVDETIYKSLKEHIEGKCSKDGYVKNNSVSIIKRSTGLLRNNQFTGDIHFQVLYSCLICNPYTGQDIQCITKQKNKMGILAEFGPLLIICPFQHHANRDIFQNINAGTNIIISVIGKRFNVNDNNISVVGKIKEVLT